MSDPTAPPFAFPSVRGKKLTAAFDGGRLTSDGGVLLLAQAVRRLRIAEKLAAVIPDRRDPSRVLHPLPEILLARILAIACGYEDADDLDHLRTDPAFKIACGRLPETGADLMGQPTVSRLENTPGLRDLIRLGRVLVDVYCASYMEFATAPQRDTFIAPVQVEAVRAAAHVRGLPSVALATAIMFEAVLRQKDVIGEWIADESAEPAGALVDRGRVWRSGLLWGEHVDPSTLVLKKPTAKSRGRRTAEHDLSTMPMVVDELAHLPSTRRVGPVIVCETTGRPWQARHFREAWRACARAAGLPDSIWCMDARAGGITEGSSSGADLAHVSKTATHTNLATTIRYNRDALSKSRKVAQLRVIARAGNGA